MKYFNLEQNGRFFKKFLDEIINDAAKRTDKFIVLQGLFWDYTEEEIYGMSLQSVINYMYYWNWEYISHSHMENIACQEIVFKKV